MWRSTAPPHVLSISKQVISSYIVKLKEEINGNYHTFPDKKEYLKELETEKNKKNKKNSKNNPYYPSAEIHFSNQEPRKCARDYNLEIQIDRQIRKII